MRAVAPCLLFGSVALACSVENPGAPPPADEFYFPIAVALAPAADGDAPSHLFVVNANFDLRYNAGTVQSVDLEVLEELLPDDCVDCAVENAADAIVSSVRVGSQAGSIAATPSGDRLFVAVRRDGNLTTINVDPSDGSLGCGGKGDGLCADAFRAVDTRSPSGRTARFSGEAVELKAGDLSDLGIADDGSYVLVAHRSGRFSVLVDRLGAESPGGLDDERMPFVAASLGGLPSQLYGLRFDPGSGFAWLTNARNRAVARVGVAVDGVADGDVDVEVFAASTPVISGVDDGSDTRDLLFETLPNGAPRAYLLSRRPEAVLVADVETAGSPRLRVTHVVPIGFGASKLASFRASVRGVEQTMLLASCYTSRDIYVVDPWLGRTVAVIRGATGPFALAVDAARSRLYVADFRASVVRVVSLAPLLACLEAGRMDEATCEPVHLGTLGRPNVMGELL